MSGLLERSAVELAELVRSGELSAARAGRGVAAADRRARAADQRLHPRRPRLRAGGGRRDRPRRSASVRRRPDRDQGQPAGGRDADHDVQRPVRRPRPPPRRLLRPAPARGRLRDRRQDGAAGDGDPAHHRVAPVRPDPQPVGARSHPGRLERRLGGGGGRRAWCRSPTATTAAARSGSRPPAAAWSGSSRPAGGSRSVPRAASLPGHRRRADPDGRRHRRRARRAGRLRARRRHLGAAAAGALRRAGRGATRDGCGSGWRSTRRWTAPRSIRCCEAAARDAAALLESLGHEVEEIAPPWSGLDLLPDFTRAFGPGIAMTALIGGRLAGREPTEDDVEPLTWEMWERARGSDTLSLLSAQGRLEIGGPLGRRLRRRFDVVLTPALAQRPVPIGEIHGRGPDPWDHYRRSGALHALHGDRQRHRPAGDLAAAVPRRRRAAARRPADRAAGARGGAAAARRPARAALPWAGRIPRWPPSSFRAPRASFSGSRRGQPGTRGSGRVGSDLSKSPNPFARGRFGLFVMSGVVAIPNRPAGIGFGMLTQVRIPDRAHVCRQPRPPEPPPPQPCLARCRTRQRPGLTDRASRRASRTRSRQSLRRSDTDIESNRSRPRRYGSADAEHRAHRLGDHAEPLGVGGAVAADQRHLEQLGLVPGGERRRARRAARPASAAAA